jgi:hypothetical protein
MNESTMDIYLIQGCQARPEWPPFMTGHTGETALLSLRIRLAERRPGFLGLDLSMAEAQALLDACRQVGARGSVVAARYRAEAALRMEDAMDVADTELDRAQRHHPGVAFEPTRFVREEALWWVFCRPSQQLIDAGFVPGALYAAVDKQDGHLWSADDQAAFLQAA